MAVAGESAGGNLAAAVSLKLRDEGHVALAGQVLIYPATAGSTTTPSREQFDGLVISLKASDYFWNSYAAGRDLDSDPYAAPLSATSFVGLPPALVVLGGCDMLRDEGRQYAALARRRGSGGGGVLPRSASRLRQLRVPGGCRSIRADRPLATPDAGRTSWLFVTIASCSTRRDARRRYFSPRCTLRSTPQCRRRVSVVWCSGDSALKAEGMAAGLIPRRH